jgi:hypothetical protein
MRVLYKYLNAIKSLVQILDRWGIVGDLRSATVGSVFGAIVGLIAVAIAAQPGKETLIFTNEDGYAQPMQALLAPLNKEEREVTVTFEPPDLRDVYVCEYTRIVGFSYYELVLFYFDKYSMCLLPIKRSEVEFVIKPNLHSGFLANKDGNWLCKCGPEQP